MTTQTNPIFNGFPDDGDSAIRIPQTFFTQLLPHMQNLPQLQLLLYLYWHSESQQNKVRHFRRVDLSADPALEKMIGDQEALERTLESLISLGAILRAELDWMDEVYYFINNPQGQAALKAIEMGEWHDFQKNQQPIHLIDEKPNIFKLYEENIGVITPMMAEILKDDEATYPPWWIEKAIKLTVEQNVHSWKYVQAILKRWQKEGIGDEQNRRDNSQDPESYRKGWLKRQ